MIREICDLCKKNDADRRYKIKQSVKGYKYGAAYLGNVWLPYEQLVICDECAKKLFSIISKDESK